MSGPDYRGLLHDVADEEAALDRVVADLDAAGWATRTPAAGWDVRDSVAHLAFTEDLAVVALRDPDAFTARRDTCSSTRATMTCSSGPVARWPAPTSGTGGAAPAPRW